MPRANTRRMHELRDRFFEQGKKQDADPDPEVRALAVCWLCKERIDYQVRAGTTPDSHNLDHYHTVKDRPDLQDDPDNFRHAHMLCNLNRGAKAPSLGLGDTIPQWW